ncbi:MAG: glycosyltransferase family 2 protein [Nitrospirae bacterium]|nr:glycosyltransferase family 2 protein [Nitrospirota bacterium]
MRASIIIPTYNNVNVLKDCLDSILANTDLFNKEVIVVANGCTDGTRDFLKSTPKEIRLDWHNDPLGYVGAVNTGLHKASGEYIVLLNDDIVMLDNNWFPMLLRPFEENVDCGITGPSKWWRFGYPLIAFWCAMFRQDVLNKVGYLDDIFNPGNGEDIDFCIKVSKIGKKVISTPIDYNCEEEIKDPTVTMFPINHLGGMTFGREHEKTMMLRMRSEQILKERYL